MSHHQRATLHVIQTQTSHSHFLPVRSFISPFVFQSNQKVNARWTTDEQLLAVQGELVVVTMVTSIFKQVKAANVKVCTVCVCIIKSFNTADGSEGSAR